MKVPEIRAAILEALKGGPLPHYSLICGTLPMMARVAFIETALAELEQENLIQRTGESWQLCPQITTSSPDSDPVGGSMD
jgi:hypothetical protein